ncbi:MAG: proton-conducting membrane transporter [Oscillospiraceae bacterium]|nr:proton-conducting membrane transporter [Oscillospiraceae bacterium]
MIILAILIPVVGAVFAFRTEDGARRRRICVTSIAAAALVSAAAPFLSGDVMLLRLNDTLSLHFYGDFLGLFFVILVGFIWFFVEFHAFGYMKHEGNEPQFFGFFLLTYAALIGLAFSANAVTLYMCFELMTLCSMPLVLHNGSEQSRRASFAYLGYSTLGASLALLGFFILAAQGNDLTFLARGGQLAGDEKTLFAAAFLIILGFGAKAGMVPLQMWLTEAHPVAPSPASAVLSGLITKGGVLAIIRCTFQLFGREMLAGTWVQTAILVLSVITIFTGSMLALKEKLLKKRMAYSTISNVSYVLFGLFTFTDVGIVGAFLQILFHALAKDALFLCAGSIIFATGKTKVDELKGIGRQMPVTMWCFAIASLSLIGIPPMGGFFAKYCLAMGALATSSVLATVGVVVLMVSALLTAFYLLPIVAAAFFPGRDFEAGEKCEVEKKMLVPPIVFSGLTVILGMFPFVLTAFAAIINGWLL